MIKRRIICLVLLLCLLLPACGREGEELSGSTQTIEILLDNTSVLQLTLPAELQVVKRDNYHYWEFTNDVAVYRMTSTTTTAKQDEETGLYVSDTAVIRNFDNCCVMINCPKQYKDVIMKYLSTAKLTEKDAVAYIEMKQEKLPEYAEQEMFLIGNMFMPDGCEDVLYDVYEAKLYTEGSEWLQSFIVDAKLDDLKSKLLTMALINSGCERVTGWYQDDDIFYCYTDTSIVGAKKLAYNSWYVYYGATAFKDYILTGINTVHGETRRNPK